MQCYNQFSAGAAQQQQRTALSCHRPHRSIDGTRIINATVGSCHTLQQPRLPFQRSVALNPCWQPQRAVAAHVGPPVAVNADTKKLAVFVSGGGSNFKAIHAACLSGHINAQVVAVVSDVPSCGGVSYGKEHGIPTLTYPASKKGMFPGLSREQLLQEMTDRGVDYVLLAGYLKLVPEELVRCYKHRMLNIHPGLLPSFGGHGMYGQRVHAAVIKSGARFSGPTVHFVDVEYDTGPILAQRCVPVYPTDTPNKLAARVLEQEHKVYPFAVAALVDGRVTWREDGIPTIWEAH